MSKDGGITIGGGIDGLGLNTNPEARINIITAVAAYQKKGKPYTVCPQGLEINPNRVSLWPEYFADLCRHGHPLGPCCHKCPLGLNNQTDTIVGE